MPACLLRCVPLCRVFLCLRCAANVLQGNLCNVFALLTLVGCLEVVFHLTANILDSISLPRTITVS